MGLQVTTYAVILLDKIHVITMVRFIGSYRYTDRSMIRYILLRTNVPCVDMAGHIDDTKKMVEISSKNFEKEIRLGFLS